MKRQTFVVSSLAMLCGSAAHVWAAPDVNAELARLERSTGGRLGVAAIDTGTGQRVTHRGDERFPMCSTFKVLAAAAVLARADAGEDVLGRKIRYGKSDLLDYAPITREHAAQGYMSLEALCAAAIEYSDNTAANLLLREIGGPLAVTAYVRGLGDRRTRLDRTEPSLNSALPGDPRDTTTPDDMVHDVRTLLLGNVLSDRSGALLASWMQACRTGDGLLRAGLPRSWRIGDKSGMGGSNNRFGESDTRNDVAIAWPAGRAPIVIAAYLTRCELRAPERDAVLASAGRIVAAQFSGR